MGFGQSCRRCVPGRNRETRIDMNCRVLQFNGVADQFLNELVERFPGGTFQSEGAGIRQARALLENKNDRIGVGGTSACLPAPETIHIGTPCLFLAFNKPLVRPMNSIMPTYCVNIVALENGFFELHNFEGRCSKMPQLGQLILVGNHEDCYPAVVEAGKHFKQVVGCPECCKACSVDL